MWFKYIAWIYIEIITSYAFLFANSAAASFQLGLESGGLGINKQVEGGVDCKGDGEREGYIRIIASDT